MTKKHVTLLYHTALRRRRLQTGLNILISDHNKQNASHYQEKHNLKRKNFIKNYQNKTHVRLQSFKKNTSAVVILSVGQAVDLCSGVSGPRHSEQQ